MESKFIIYIVCGILALILIFKEIKRNSKCNLAWRILASLLMVISFAFLIIPISYQTSVRQAKAELNLITEGTDLDTITKIKGEKFDLDSNLFSDQKKLKIKHIEDLAYYLQEHKDIKKVNIFGYGLHEEQLNKLQDYQISFHPAAIPSGIISASWQKEIKTTENLNVQGVYNNTSNTAIWLKLFGLGTNLDSTIIKANSKINFSFHTQPKQSGQAIYQLNAFKGKDTLFAEPIPFEVKPKRPIQILILASFPDFEYKFLKNWLYEKQYQVVFRSQISKEKYSSDFLNTKAIDVTRINQTLLKQMDVVLIDEDEMSGISASERAAINAAVSNGMGLIIRLTNVKPNSNSLKYGRYEIPLVAATAFNIRAVNENIKFSELPFPQTLFLETSQNEQALFKSTAGKTVVNTQLNGMGRVLISSLSSTYQWELAGKKTDYAMFWSTLFLKAARKELKNQSVDFWPQFLTIGSRSRLITTHIDNKVPNIAFNELTLNPKQNMELPFKWDAIFWPTIAGWNKVRINDTMSSAFIYKPSDWSALKNTLKINLNADFSIRPLNGKSDLKVNTHNLNEEVSKWWFFAIFLIAATYLWYEQRFLAN